ncbi:MAG: Sulfoxide reductase catalytic subunit YedY [Verrucomicrobiae bacterium]|nr:Sulfoxide reductase catalytic subunit YedY [Verrucomicrobiae bacterium]
MINKKLIEAKERLAKTARNSSPAATGKDRLPPGQHEVKNWPVLDLGIQPDIPKEKWSLTISGLVANPRQFTWDEFMELPQAELVRDFHCVTTWSRFDNHWRGVEFKTICDIVKPSPQATHIVCASYDDYTTNLPLNVALDDLLLVHTWEGQPLSREHGGPVRGVVSKIYAWKGAKWIKEIEFLPVDQPGFWEVRGYSNTADPWKEERYS